MSEQLSPDAPVQGNFAKTFIAMMWVYGGRGVGLLWTVMLVHQLGVDDYGQYGLAIAVNALVGPTLDNPFVVRSVRESDDRFAAERTARYLLALILIALGLLLFGRIYFVGFGLVVAGGEMAMNVITSPWVRGGHPERAARMATARQTTSLLGGGAYLYVADHPTIATASLLYCVPYAVAVVAGAVAVRKHRPSLPGPPRLMLALSGEMLGTAAYLQGDVLLLGALTDSTTVGYYSLAWVVCAAVIAVGQSFSATYNEPLRLSGGALSSGPPLKHTLAIALSGGALVLIAGVGVLISPAATQLALALMIMSGFVAARVVIWVFQAVLYAQRRDLFRLTAAVTLVPFKFGLVAALSFLGAVGAAIATTTTDALLLAIFAGALYRKPNSDPDG